jgi:flagellar hook protein FlgE
MLYYQRVSPVNSRSWQVGVFEKSGDQLIAVNSSAYRLYFDDTGHLATVSNPSADRFVSNQSTLGNEPLSTIMGQSLRFNGAAGQETYITPGVINFSSGTVGGETVTIGSLTLPPLSAHATREEAAAELAALINQNAAAAGCFALNDGFGRITLQPLGAGPLAMRVSPDSASYIQPSAASRLDEVILAINNGRAAAGAVNLNNLLAAGETVSVGGRSYIIPAAASLEEMAVQLAELINGDSASPVSATAGGGIIALTAKEVGQEGNQLALSSTPPASGYLSLSSSTLIGGINDSQVSLIDAQSEADPLLADRKHLALQRIGAGAGAVITGLFSDFTPQGGGVPLSFSKTSSASNGTVSSDGKATVNFTFNGSSQPVVMDYAPYGAYPAEQYSTQQAITSTLRELGQDGYPEGFVNGLEINDYGDVIVSYSNEQVKRVGTIALAHFLGMVELERIGDTLWLANQASGAPLIDLPQTYRYGMGTIQSGSLEKSNVDTALEMVNMRTYQRAYQFNTKSITTSDEMLKEAINMKR